MDAPSHRLRTALIDVVTNLTALYTNVPPHSHLAVSSLVVAISNLVHVQESINDSIRATLRAEHRRYTRVEARVTSLESVLPRTIPRHISTFHESQKSNSDAGCVNDDGSRSPSIANQLPREEDVDINDDIQASGAVSNNSMTSNFNAKAQAVPVTSSIQNALAAPPVLPTNCTSRVRAAFAPKRRRSADSPKNARSDLPPAKRMALPSPPKLPTAREVEENFAHRSRMQRAATRKLPPPCAKCRVRKRADMMRDFGRVKEDVYERWLVKPGGCLGFMHMDEPGAPRSPLTFEETPTQSPRAHSPR